MSAKFHGGNQRSLLEIWGNISLNVKFYNRYTFSDRIKVGIFYSDKEPEDNVSLSWELELFVK